jgi:hypothetical protein
MAVQRIRPGNLTSSFGSDQTMRGLLALTLVLGGITAIVLTAYIDLYSSSTQANSVFTAVLGVAGTWVSTVIVFYASRENFQAAQTVMASAVDSSLNAPGRNWPGQRGAQRGDDGARQAFGDRG